MTALSPVPDGVPADAVRAVDLVVEEIRERLCSRLDVVADTHHLSFETVLELLADRHGGSYASDYEDWVLDSTTTDQGEQS